MKASDLAKHPDAFAARSRPIVVGARFAQGPGVLATLEGPVAHAGGDAIVTGLSGEHWPVARERFLASYDACPPTQAGEDGRYAKRPRDVLALRLSEPVSVDLSGQRGQLHGRAGDVLVQYAPGDWAIIDSEIFGQSYETLR